MEKGNVFKLKRDWWKLSIVLLPIILAFGAWYYVIIRNGIKVIEETDNYRVEERRTASGIEEVKVNVSEQFKKERIFDGMTVINIKFEYQKELSKFLADVKNDTNEPRGGYAIQIELYDKYQEVITVVDGFLDEIEPGGKRTINSSVVSDEIDVYDFKLLKKQ